MATEYVSDYEAVTGLKREQADAAPVETKVVEAPEVPQGEASGVEVETA